MAQLHRLTARTVATATKPGAYADGGNLYLMVDKSGSKRWACIYRWAGRRREKGLGSVLDVPLALAREKARECREQIAAGIDPIAKAKTKAAAVPTFGEFAARYLELKQPGWRNDKHRAQWRMTLTTYGRPLWDKPIDAITTEDVLEVLVPLWQRVPETASRLRGRIEAVLDGARAAGHRTADNVARWKGHLASILPKPAKLSRGHHRALRFDEVPAFVARLQATGGASATRSISNARYGSCRPHA